MRVYLDVVTKTASIRDNCVTEWSPPGRVLARAMTTENGTDGVGSGSAAMAVPHLDPRQDPSICGFPASPIVPVFIGLLLLSFALSVSAHSFNVAFVASESGPRVEQGRRALDGFLMATAERDRHPNETSDGHLGGMDVHVFRVDDVEGPESVRRQVRMLLDLKDIRFVFGAFEPELNEVIRSAVSGTPAIVVHPLECAMYRASAGDAERLMTMTGEPFSTAFHRAEGYQAGAFATNGYIAARLIDATVRAAEPRLDENGALKEAYDNACDELR